MGALSKFLLCLGALEDQIGVGFSASNSFEVTLTVKTVYMCSLKLKILEFQIPFFLPLKKGGAANECDLVTVCGCLKAAVADCELCIAVAQITWTMWIMQLQQPLPPEVARLSHGGTSLIWLPGPCWHGLVRD